MRKRTKQTSKEKKKVTTNDTKILRISQTNSVEKGAKRWGTKTALGPKIHWTMSSSSSEKSILQRVQQSNGVLLLLTLLSVITYAQDIFQDVLVISGSIASKEVYNVLFNLKIAERNFGFVMAGMFGLSVVVVGWDSAVKVQEEIWWDQLKFCYLAFILGVIFGLAFIVETQLWAFRRFLDWGNFRSG